MNWTCGIHLESKTFCFKSRESRNFSLFFAIVGSKDNQREIIKKLSCLGVEKYFTKNIVQIYMFLSVLVIFSLYFFHFFDRPCFVLHNTIFIIFRTSQDLLRIL